jgi:hypothetical protein
MSHRTSILVRLAALGGGRHQIGLSPSDQPLQVILVYIRT